MCRSYVNEEMAENIETTLLYLLDGKYFDELTKDMCDFTIIEQNIKIDTLNAKKSQEFQPILERTVTYIVACILINENNEVLMMQEAKQSCAGTWYLPAGRMEKGESIREAAIREVFEETGLNVDITTLLGVECAAGSWFRFILTGTIIGGELKTPARADKESLQAKWIHDLNELNLRSNDILSVIDIGREFYRNQKLNHIPKHKSIMPIEKAHGQNYLRIIAVIKKRSTNTMHVLLSKKKEKPVHFPIVEIHPQKSIHSTMRTFLQEFFIGELPQHRPHGIVAVEHNATGIVTDGVCLTVLVPFRPALEDVVIINKNSQWHELAENVSAEIIKVLSNKNGTLVFNVRR